MQSAETIKTSQAREQTSAVPLTAEETAFAEIIGDLMEQWGFKRHLGRIWSLLYLRQHPLNPSQIQQALGLSSGSVSSLLAELQTWGAVKRIRIAADRNFYYEAEPHIWRTISNVLRAREVRILEEATGGLRALEGALKRRPKTPFTEHQRTRVEMVRNAIDTGLLLANQFVSLAPHKGLAALSKWVGKLKTF